MREIRKMWWAFHKLNVHFAETIFYPESFLLFYFTLKMPFLLGKYGDSRWGDYFLMTYLAKLKDNVPAVPSSLIENCYWDRSTCFPRPKDFLTVITRLAELWVGKPCSILKSAWNTATTQRNILHLFSFRNCYKGNVMRMLQTSGIFSSNLTIKIRQRDARNSNRQQLMGPGSAGI